MELSFMFTWHFKLKARETKESFMTYQIIYRAEMPVTKTDELGYIIHQISILILNVSGVNFVWNVNEVFKSLLFAPLVSYVILRVIWLGHMIF